MKDIVKYHNDLNDVNIPNFNETNQNLFALIMLEIGDTKAGELKTISVDKLRSIFVNDYKSNREIFHYLLNLRDNFFKADFQRIIRDKNGLARLEIINLFSKFTLGFDEPDEKPKSEWTNFLELQLIINPEFEYIVHKLKANYTAFELKEFISISGKYTKTLYRLLKQYRSTGRVEFKWDEFMRLLDIPKNYQQFNIDQRILKPAIAELQKPRNLFDQERIPFENLTYTKIKSKGRGRGGKVIAIRFEFKPQRKSLEPAENTQKPQEPSAIPAPALEPAPKSQEPAQESTGKGTQMLEALHAKLSAPKFTADEINKIQADYEMRSIKNEQKEILLISSIQVADDKIKIDFKNRDNAKGKGYSKEFEDIAHFKNYIKQFDLI